MIPQATIVHRTPSRLRVKIASRKGDETYFEDLKEQLAGYKKWPALQVNALTGSVLFVDGDMDEDALIAHADRKGLFHITDAKPLPVPISHRLLAPLDQANRSLTRTTGGHVDLPGLVFLMLLVFGLMEIARGNLTRPPWYTAFWYASGVFSKHIADRLKDSP
jgi:hypothetical protein